MKKFFSRRTRNRILIVTTCAMVLGLSIYGTASAFRMFTEGQTPARAANAGLQSAPPRVSSSVSAAPPSKVSSSAASSKAQQIAVSSVPSAASSKARDISHNAGTLPSGRTVYLTFDDGPSSLTEPLLEVLDRYKVKATFFVVGVNDKNETRDLKEIVKRGHAIGVHSWSHNYHQIYASVNAFFSDYDRIHQAIFDATGVDTKICRFPGGSVNSYNKKVRNNIFEELKRRGDVYFDWNAGGADAAGAKTPDAIYSNAIQGVHSHRVSVVLFHNTAAKGATLRQVPRFISTLQSEGYRFDVLSPSVSNAPFIF